MKKTVFLLLVVLFCFAGLYAMSGKQGAAADAAGKQAKQGEQAKDQAGGERLVRREGEIRVAERRVKKQPEAEKSKRVRGKQSQMSAGMFLSEVEFLDEQGAVKKVFREKHEEFDGGYKTLRMEEFYNSRIIVVSNKTETKNDSQTAYETGWEYKIENDVEIYNEEGKVIGGKKGLDCLVEGVSEDGARFLCFRGNPDSVDDVVRSSEIDLGKMAKILVFTKDGKLLFSKDSPGRGFHLPKLSPNGEWVVARNYDWADEVYVYGLNGEEFVIRSADIDGIFLGNYRGINNKGELEYARMFEEGQGNWVERRFLYSPATKTLTRIIEE
ncbi:MAG TPA: hypothetical protein ENN43_07775 [bacterium]|nr:hypothetical protein [bacterium]